MRVLRGGRVGLVVAGGAVVRRIRKSLKIKYLSTRENKFRGVWFLPKKQSSSIESFENSK